MIQERVQPLYVKKLQEKAIIPKKGSQKAAGYDLFSTMDITVPAQGKALIKTGISIAVPSGNYGRIAPRSGLAWKNFIDVGAGVIDEDYRGEVGVILFNHSVEDFKVQYGDRIAQLIIEKISQTDIIETDQLDYTERGEAGFGSTGVQMNSQERKKASVLDYSAQVEQIKAMLMEDKENSHSGQNEENQEEKRAILVYEIFNMHQNKAISPLQRKKMVQLAFGEKYQNLEKIVEEYKSKKDIEKLNQSLQAIL